MERDFRMISLVEPRDFPCMHESVVGRPLVAAYNAICADDMFSRESIARGFFHIIYTIEAR